MVSGEKIQAYSMFISNQKGREKRKSTKTKEQVQRIENTNMVDANKFKCD